MLVIEDNPRRAIIISVPGCQNNYSRFLVRTLTAIYVETNFCRRKCWKVWKPQMTRSVDARRNSSSEIKTKLRFQLHLNHLLPFLKIMYMQFRDVPWAREDGRLGKYDFILGRREKVVQKAEICHAFRSIKFYPCHPR